MDPPLPQRRGLAITEFAGTERHFFLRTPIDRAAEALVEFFDSTGHPVFWKRDAAGPNVLFQLNGHPWTGALHLGPTGHTPAAPRELSRRLNGQVLVLGHLAPASTTFYELFDAGVRVEDFYHTPPEPGRFRSAKRTVESENLDQPLPFLDAALKHLDLYAHHAPIDVGDAPDDDGSDVFTLADPDLPRDAFLRIDLLVPR